MPLCVCVRAHERVPLILPETACPLAPCQWKLMSGSAYVEVIRNIIVEKVDGRLPAEKLTDGPSACAMKSCAAQGRQMTACAFVCTCIKKKKKVKNVPFRVNDNLKCVDPHSVTRLFLSLPVER